MKSVIAGVTVLMVLVIAAFAVQPETQPVKSDQPAKVVEDQTKSQEQEKLVYFQMTTLARRDLP